MIKLASLSPCGLYRFSLERVWDEGRAQVNFVMLNPSTADAEVDDATIRKCVRFATDWGHGGIVVTNLFAWRATDPRELKGFPKIAVGYGNDRWIADVAERSHLIVCAWGNHGALVGRGAEVLAGLRKNGHGAKLHYLRRCQNGEPSHPLYLKGSLEPTLFPATVGVS